MDGQESYSRLLTLRARRLSQTTSATTVSGRSTPDNHSTLSQSSYSGSVYGQTEPTGRDSVLGRLTPSEVGSAFSRPTSSASSVSNFRFRRYGYNSEMDPGDRYSLPQYSPGQMSTEELQRRLRLRLSKQESLTEADEEMPHYGLEDNVSKYRRTSLPVHQSGSKKWDFKSRRNASFVSPRLPIPVGRVSPLTPVTANSHFAEQLNSLNQEGKKINLSPNDPDHPTLSRGSTSDTLTLPSVVNPTKDDQVITQESTEGENSGTSNTAKVCDGPRSESKMSSVGSNSEDTERHGYTGGSSVDDGESQSTPTSPEPSNAEIGLNTPAMLPCSTPVPQTGSTNLGEAGEIADEIPLQAHPFQVDDDKVGGVSDCEQITADSPQVRISPRVTSTVDVPPTPAEETSSSHMTTTVDVFTAPVITTTHDHSPESLVRKISTTSMEVADINGHQTPIEFNTSIITTSPIAVLTNNEVPRKKSAPEATQRKASNPSTILTSKSVPSFEATRSFNDFQRTIDKATEFELAMRALAESGSSDQDSDTEPHRAKPESVSASEQEKIQKKMRTTIQPNQLKAHRFVLKRRPGTSFGFSLADGLYDPGIYVKAVNVGSPADNAGVQPFDTLLKVSKLIILSEWPPKTLKTLDNYT